MEYPTMVAINPTRAADFRELILARLKEIGWRKTRLARHDKVTMHPTSVFRYLRGSRDTDGKSIAELLQILGWRAGSGFSEPAIEPTHLRDLDNPSVLTKARAGTPDVPDATDVAVIRQHHAQGLSLSQIVEKLDDAGVCRSSGKAGIPHNRASVWYVVKAITEDRTHAGA